MAQWWDHPCTYGCYFLISRKVLLYDFLGGTEHEVACPLANFDGGSQGRGTSSSCQQLLQWACLGLLGGRGCCRGRPRNRHLLHFARTCSIGFAQAST
eukprot:1157900-Pelagomonas_calceolata.AAC.14